MWFYRVALENRSLNIEGRNFRWFRYRTINAVTSGRHFQKFADFLSTCMYMYILKTLYQPGYTSLKKGSSTIFYRRLYFNVFRFISWSGPERTRNTGQRIQKWKSSEAQYGVFRLYSFANSATRTKIAYITNRTRVHMEYSPRNTPRNTIELHALS